VYLKAGLLFPTISVSLISIVVSSDDQRY